MDILSFLTRMQMDLSLDPVSLQEETKRYFRTEPAIEYSTRPGYDLDSGYDEWSDEFGPNTEYYLTAARALNAAAAIGVQVVNRLPTIPGWLLESAQHVADEESEFDAV